MAFENLVQLNFTEEELAKVDASLAEIERILKGKTHQLTPQERRQYGSIAEQNKLFVNKAKQLMEQYPEYVPNFLDKAEFDEDYLAREQIGRRLQKLKNLVEQLSDTKVLLDHDNYFNALSFYRNVKYLSRENIPGIKSIYDEMNQFFVKPNKPESSKSETDKQTS